MHVEIPVITEEKWGKLMKITISLVVVKIIPYIHISYESSTEYRTVENNRR